MNKIYRLIWNESLNTWSVACELAKGKKKSATVSGILLLSMAMAVANPQAQDGIDGKAGADASPTKVLTQSISNDDKIVAATGKNGTSGTAGQQGKTATNQPTDSVAQVGGNGGAGGTGGQGGAVFVGDNDFTLNNRSDIKGGTGGNGGNGGIGGIGGNGIVLPGRDPNVNVGDLALGATGGIGGLGGTGGSGGNAVEGRDLIINNAAGALIEGGQGGIGGDAGKSGQGGAGGSNVNISQGAIGAVGGTGGNGGQGGAGIMGDQLTIHNLGQIKGGTGGIGGAGGTGGQGGFDGSGITESKSADGNVGGNAGTGGQGGSAIKGAHITINNENLMIAGDGGQGADTQSYGGLDGAGGAGGNNLQGDSSAFLGGNGGQGGKGGTGGQGGIAIEVEHGTITNSGVIRAGNGGDGTQGYLGGIGGNTAPLNGPGGVGGQGGDGGNGGDGGIAIKGADLTILNTGSIYGGNGGKGGAGGSGSVGGSGSSYGASGKKGANGASGNAGIAIEGADLRITNHGLIQTGSGNDPTAIHFTKGINQLTLEDGSKIVGDIVLKATDQTNQLTLNAQAKTAVDGALKAGNNSQLMVSGGQAIGFNEITLDQGVKVHFTDVGSLTANAISMQDATFSLDLKDWDQTSVTLMKSDQPIHGAAAEGELMISGQKANHYTQISQNEHIVQYSLSWYGLGDRAHGTFDIAKDDALAIKVPLNDHGSLNPSWDGQSLTKTGQGNLVLMAQNGYTGQTTINDGQLSLAVHDAIASSQHILVDEKGVLNLSGNDQTLLALDNRGTILLNDDSAQKALAQKVTVTGDIEHSGHLIIGNMQSVLGQTYTQQGNWHGNNGLVTLGVKVGGDDSPKDQLIITGNATGTTRVAVLNRGGQGAQTVEGIEIIQTGHSDANAFVQEGRIVAGSYEYYLKPGAAGQNSNHWYLTSKQDGGTIDPTPDPTPVPKPTYRPEGGSYAANLAAAGSLFNTRLSDRVGETWYTDPITGTMQQTTLWSRVSGAHMKGRMSDEQSQLSSDRYVVQLGGDLFSGSWQGMDAVHFGLMAGYAHASNTNKNHLSHHSTKGEVDGYSAGLYGTWYQNAASSHGWYVDGWLLYNWFNNTVKGDLLDKEKYHSKGLTASLESGYVWQAANWQNAAGASNALYVIPQAQVIWSGVKSDRHVESNGTVVEGMGHDHVLTRLGVRVSLKHEMGSDPNGMRLEPFVEANWLHQSKAVGVRMDQVDTYLEGMKNRVEFKAGLEAHINSQFGVWGNVSHTTGTKHHRETKVMVGFNYRF
ncbi:hypothetical protein B9T11_00640 [Wohlfahrtiimonas chitiniclastica]|uniref:autotransporter outer membrane beta-barrel domain-containing protein n=1 Tax=Wohlfahrtiimonas chitiniclastica TaxID=400946 RepID=UPI000B9970E4|nr:autotransporter outer membrane beta-barrel domain-containing protein [Wohlfahrtiimonas chitiniclastica]OYQ82663.1 hypothetical protein B9T11_00640 [Wohlfahrtiimonas chitiniclastica]